METPSTLTSPEALAVLRLVHWPEPQDAKAMCRDLVLKLGDSILTASEAAQSSDSGRRKAGRSFLASILRGFRSTRDELDAAVRALPNPGGYTLLPLSAWLACAKACGVEAIPHELGPALTQRDIEDAYEAIHALDYGRLPEVVRREVLPWVAAQQERGWMWRYEFCAPETIKQVLGCIRPPQYLRSTRISVPFSVDGRVLRCMWDMRLAPNGVTRLIARPWVQATFEAGFPVEFRVFRQPDGYAACNYYIQRPLPERYLSVMEEAVRLTEEFERKARELTLDGVPILPATFTVDWLLRDDGRLVMIEAGPPFTSAGGAHPCCFSLKAGVTAGRRLLALEPGAMGYCPPRIQALVDQVKAGRNPIDVARESDSDPRMLLAFAGLQGDLRAQEAMKLMAQAGG